MKGLKRYIILIIMILILSGIGYVVYANSNTTQICGGLEESILPETEKLIDYSVPNDMILEINNKEVELKYKYSINSNDIYVDKYNTEYIMDDNEVVGFIKDNIKTSMKKNNIYSQDTIMNIAVDYCSNIVKEFDKYELSSMSYIESYNEYSIIFVNKFKGYNTQDTVGINITPSGEVVSFCANNQGILEEFESQEINVSENDLKEFIETQLKFKYDSIISYEIEDKILNVINDKLAMQCYIKIELEDDVFCSEIVICYI